VVRDPTLRPEKRSVAPSGLSRRIPAFQPNVERGRVDGLTVRSSSLPRHLAMSRFPPAVDFFHVGSRNSAPPSIQGVRRLSTSISSRSKVRPRLARRRQQGSSTCVGRPPWRIDDHALENPRRSAMARGRTLRILLPYPVGGTGQRPAGRPPRRGSCGTMLVASVLPCRVDSPSHLSEAFIKKKKKLAVTCRTRAACRAAYRSMPARSSSETESVI